MVVMDSIGRRFFWQLTRNRLIKQGDTAEIILVAATRPAGFWRGRLWHLHG
jgi:hypothetical protein